MPPRTHPIAALMLGLLFLLCGTGFGASAPRKIKTQVQPTLPDIARRMDLQGTVRLEIEIAADGKVKAAKPLGGNPLLIQSAEQAVLKWRYEPGTPCKEIVEFKFHPAD